MWYRVLDKERRESLEFFLAEEPVYAFIAFLRAFLSFSLRSWCWNNNCFARMPVGWQRAAILVCGLQGVDEVGKCVVGLTTEEGLTITAKNGSAVVTQVVRALDGAGVAIEQLKLTVPTLDEVFLKLTGKTLNVIERKEAVRIGRRGIRS